MRSPSPPPPYAIGATVTSVEAEAGGEEEGGWRWWMVSNSASSLRERYSQPHQQFIRISRAAFGGGDGRGKREGCAGGHLDCPFISQRNGSGCRHFISNRSEQIYSWAANIAFNNCKKMVPNETHTHAHTHFSPVITSSTLPPPHTSFTRSNLDGRALFMIAYYKHVKTRGHLPQSHLALQTLFGPEG